jgi:hypothetical protein
MDESTKLRASPERSEGEDQFSVACEGKLTGLYRSNVVTRSYNKVYTYTEYNRF